jgi:hypothetical protein
MKRYPTTRGDIKSELNSVWVEPRLSSLQVQEFRKLLERLDADNSLKADLCTSARVDGRLYVLDPLGKRSASRAVRPCAVLAWHGFELKLVYVVACFTGGSAERHAMEIEAEARLQAPA